MQPIWSSMDSDLYSKAYSRKRFCRKCSPYIASRIGEINARVSSSFDNVREMIMKNALLILALPLAQLVNAQAYAEDNATNAVAPKSRAEVREELKMAIRSGDWHPAGEAGPAAIFYRNAQPGTTTRLEIRDETKAAAKAGALPKTGENANVGAIDQKLVSTVSRADVKADTRQAIKDKTFIGTKNLYSGD